MTTNPGDIDRYLQDQINRRIKAIISVLDRVGSKCKDEAKDNGSYKDHSSNLRNSVGYVVLNEGVVVSGGDFDQSPGGGAGKTELQNQIAKYPTGIVLIVVAGMNYAAAVEARNLNVLTSAELLAEQLVPQLLGQLGFTVKR